MHKKKKKKFHVIIWFMHPWCNEYIRLSVPYNIRPSHYDKKLMFR